LGEFSLLLLVRTSQTWRGWRVHGNVKSDVTIIHSLWDLTIIISVEIKLRWQIEKVDSFVFIY